MEMTPFTLRSLCDDTRFFLKNNLRIILILTAIAAALSLIPSYYYNLNTLMMKELLGNNYKDIPLSHIEELVNRLTHEQQNAIVRNQFIGFILFSLISAFITTFLLVYIKIATNDSLHSFTDLLKTSLQKYSRVLLLLFLITLVNCVLAIFLFLSLQGAQINNGIVLFIFYMLIIGMILLFIPIIITIFLAPVILLHSDTSIFVAAQKSIKTCISHPKYALFGLIILVLGGLINVLVIGNIASVLPIPTMLYYYVIFFAHTFITTIALIYFYRMYSLLPEQTFSSNNKLNV